jgi:hypothetical protein
MNSAPVDTCLEWCTMLGSGSREQFARATEQLLGENADRVLSGLEIAGHLEVDWERTGRWSVNPPVLALPEGSGGNAFLVGGRTEATLATLTALHNDGRIRALTTVAGDIAKPSTHFIATDSLEQLVSVASRIGACVTVDPAGLLMQQFPDLDQLLENSRAEYVPSGFGAKVLDTGTLRYEPIEVRYANWPAGCFEQLSNGRRKYIFVDDDDARYICDRWVATHAELRRRRRRGEPVRDALKWDMERERMVVIATAQLPTPWARAAVFSSGLSPRRRTGDTWWDVFEGVPLRTYGKFAKALGLPAATEDLHDFDEEQL